MTGDATRRDVLASAEIANAERLVIAVGRDDTAVLIALTARQLSPALTIIAAVREAEKRAAAPAERGRPDRGLVRRGQPPARLVLVSAAAAGPHRPDYR